MVIPIYFYYPNEIPITLNYKSGLDCWILKTFWKLKEYKSDLNIHLVNYIPDEGIIIFHKGFFPKDIMPSNTQLFVCVQADYGRHQYAQYHIAQNPFGVSNFNFSKRSFFEEKLFSFTKSYFIAHWNQNDIIKRNSSRGESFKNVCFYGIDQNFPQKLLEPSFKEKLNKEGIDLKIITDSDQWNDYSETDCVLAIRDFENKPHYNKPFSKIINSYLAGVPVIAGNESSSLYLKNGLGIGISIVTNPDECFNAIKQVKENYLSSLKRIIIDKVKLKEFQDEAIVLSWDKLLREMQQNYQLWRNSSSLAKYIYIKYRKN
ncbi:hypothetical protein [Flavobacterium sp.]|uniref:hypothetical protein n=1 Tax=Flavobacterium sp. TaxID=239 RepID=UPI0038FCB078